MSQAAAIRRRKQFAAMGKRKGPVQPKNGKTGK